MKCRSRGGPPPVLMGSASAMRKRKGAAAPVVTKAAMPKTSAYEAVKSMSIETFEKKKK